MVLPGFPWVMALRPVGARGPIPAEEDSGLEVPSVPVPVGPSLDGHDHAVDPFYRAVGDPMPAKALDVVQMSRDNLPNLAQWGQA